MPIRKKTWRRIFLVQAMTMPNQHRLSKRNIFFFFLDFFYFSIRQTRNAGANIFAPTSEETNPSAGTLAGQYKQTQMKSNIFGTDEPTSARHVSDKNKSNIFGIGDNDQNKTQGGTRQGRRGK
jgi:hypothetical protein